MRRMLNYQQQYFTQRCFVSPTQPLRPPSMLHCYCIPVFIIHNMYYYYIYLVFLHIVLPIFSKRIQPSKERQWQCCRHILWQSCHICHILWQSCHTYVWQSCHICHILWYSHVTYVTHMSRQSNWKHGASKKTVWISIII